MSLVFFFFSSAKASHMAKLGFPRNSNLLQGETPLEGRQGVCGTYTSTMGLMNNAGCSWKMDYIGKR